MRGVLSLDELASTYDEWLARADHEPYLDLHDRSRTSLFPWRGQFSPELVDRLLDETAPDGTVLDPFVGSGTTLFECARRGLSSIGVELNPAAAIFASMSRFIPLDGPARSHVIEVADGLIEDAIGLEPNGTLFSGGGPKGGLEQLQRRLVLSAHEIAQRDLAELAVGAAVMLGAGRTGPVDEEGVRQGWLSVRQSIRQIPYSTTAAVDVLVGDCRTMPLNDDAISAVIGSPPYINVFNYHQNYRPAVEWLGLRPLSIARGEIGSNRKHRGNRLLTVIQYPMDMARVLSELGRVARPGAAIVLVVGRESNVRGLSFPNGKMLAMTAQAACEFVLEDLRVRSFTNRFGSRIWEDILVLRPPEDACSSPDVGREIGVWALREHVKSTLDTDVRDDLDAALDRAEDVDESPMVTAPAVMAV